MATIKREIHGLMKNGQEVFLGSVETTKEELENILSIIARSYRDNTHSYVNVGMGVFKTQDFAGFWVK